MEMIVNVEGPSLHSPLRTDLSRSADKLEAAFLAEMLKIVMPEGGGGAFGGGIGESQFASFLTERHAAAMAARLDLNLVTRLADHA